MVLMTENVERQKFLQFLTFGVVNAADTIGQFKDSAGNTVLLETLRQSFGNNLNTLILLNRDVVDFDIILDGNTITTLAANNGSFAFDWQDGINYSKLELKNIDASTASTDSKVRITVGRTGVN
jgi:hypothetical protein